jgi:hypothetical protein
VKRIVYRCADHNPFVAGFVANASVRRASTYN